MTHFYLLLWPGLLLLAVGCTDAEPESLSNANVPWRGATFVNPAVTTLTFSNHGDATRSLDINLLYYQTDLDKRIPDSLAPGASASVDVEIHHPGNLFYGSGDQRSMRLVLPGRGRHFVHEADTIIEKGDYALEYNFFDAAFIPLNPAGRRPPVITNLDSFRRSEELITNIHFDSLIRPEGLPAYVESFLGRTTALRSYGSAFQMRSYYKFFYKDTLAVSPEMIDSIDLILQKPSYYQTPEYQRLQESLAVYRGETAENLSSSVASNNNAAIAAGYLNGYPAPERRHDATATHLAYLICDSRVYSGKMENIDKLRTSLPQPYREKLDEIQRQAIELSASENGLADFLDASYATPAGPEATVNTLASKPLRLLKYWFAGCYPCLVQQPHEVKLLAAHPDVDLIYVAHNTKEQDWQDYLLKHRPPTDLQLFVPLKDRKVIESSAGTTGAPTYVMVDAQGETICRPCPKPSDPLLGKLIAEELRSKDR